MGFEAGERAVNINKMVAAAATFLGTVLVMVVVGWALWQLISPRFERVRNRDNPNIVPFYVFFDYEPETMHLVLEGERMRDMASPIIHSEVLYLPLDFIRTHLDPFMFWDAGAQTLFVSTRYEMQSFRIGDVRIAGGMVYVPADLVMGLYPVTVVFYPSYNMVVVTLDHEPQRVAPVSGTAPVRYRPDAAAPMTTRLTSGDVVTLFGEAGLWTRVRTDAGLLGYVLTSSLGVASIVPPPPPRPWLFAAGYINNFVSRQPNWDGGRINLVWDTVYDTQTPLPESLTVVSPNWFRFNRYTQALNLDPGINYERMYEYVRWAQAQGVQVWPNVTDVYADPGIGAILMDAAARRRVIDQLVYYVDMLGLDGLSVNIEALWSFRYGPYYIQFMRELNLALGHHIIIMAAMKVDPFGNPHYRHDLIAQTVDFIALMTYDEHHGNSPHAGPVASLPWVEDRVAEMLRLVPANQLLMGLPFYNRVWRTSVVELTRRPSFNWSMDRTIQELYERGEEKTWDPVVGSYYAEWVAVVSGEALEHQIWLECPRSIGAKMQIYAVYNLAGVAGWNLGFTNEAVWEVLGNYFR